MFRNKSLYTFLVALTLSSAFSSNALAKSLSEDSNLTSATAQTLQCQPQFKFEDENGVQYLPMNLELVLKSTASLAWNAELFDISDANSKVSMGTAQITPVTLKKPIPDHVLDLVSFVLDIATTDVVRIELFELIDQGSDSTGASLLRVYTQFHGIELHAGDVFQMGWGAGVCEF